MKLLKINCVFRFSLQLLPEIFLILERTERHKIKNIYGPSINLPNIILDTQISSFMKIHPVGDKLFHVDRQTDMTKLMVIFCYFANMPKNQKSTVHFYSN